MATRHPRPILTITYTYLKFVGTDVTGITEVLFTACLSHKSVAQPASLCNTPPPLRFSRRRRVQLRMEVEHDVTHSGAALSGGYGHSVLSPSQTASDGEGPRAVIGAPTPFRIYRPEGNVGEDHDRCVLRSLCEQIAHGLADHHLLRKCLAAFRLSFAEFMWVIHL